MGGRTLAELGVWVARSSAIRVEYSPSVLDEIRAAAVEGLCTFPRGGIEIGGILFGTVEDHTVRVLARAPVSCSYATGPSFTIAGADTAVFERALGASPDPEALQPVGWYHSHTRAGLELSGPDVALHERYFPDPSQVALVVRPEPFGTASATFHLRGADGVLAMEPEAEFLLRPNGRRRQPRPEPAGAQPPARPEVELPVFRAPAQPHSRALPRAEPPPPPPAAVRSRPRAPVAATAAVVVAALVWASVLLWHPQGAARLALKVTDTQGLLRIAWNRNARPVLQATGASLEIVDGGESFRLPFDREKLRAGSVTYSRRTGNVEVRLRVFGPSPAEEFVRLFAPAQPAPQAVPEPPEAPPSEPPEPEPETQVARAAVPTPPPAHLRTDEPESIVPVRRLDVTAIPAPRRGGLPVPPQVALAAVPPSGAALISKPPSAPPPRLIPREPIPEAAKHAAYSGPSAGRVIWVGQLAPGATLAIDGQRATTGVLSGELPGVPVHIAAHPAELAEGGLRVYASSPTIARRAPEPAGPNNGWNPTTYAWSSARAGDVLVVEPPSPQNGWKRLAVRGGGPVSMIVIDWRVAN